MMKVA
jgi:hypothetical protein